MRRQVEQVTPKLVSARRKKNYWEAGGIQGRVVTDVELRHFETVILNRLIGYCHAEKNCLVWSVLGLNMGTEYGKICVRKISLFGQFSYSVNT